MKDVCDKVSVHMLKMISEHLNPPALDFGTLYTATGLYQFGHYTHITKQYHWGEQWYEAMIFFAQVKVFFLHKT